ncbi:MAG: hypothetical protein HKP40_04040 [Litoreibacter sp.]|nr:hypothetical protein [Litoreibacter sp.]
MAPPVGLADLLCPVRVCEKARGDLLIGFLKREIRDLLDATTQLPRRVGSIGLQAGTLDFAGLCREGREKTGERQNDDAIHGGLDYLLVFFIAATMTQNALRNNLQQHHGLKL